MASFHSGNVQPSIDLEEHMSKGQVFAKKVVLYSYDSNSDTLSPYTGGSVLPSALVNGQQTTTTSAVALPSGTLTQGVVIEALAANAASVWVGNASLTAANGYELAAGATVSIIVSNLSNIYILGANTSDKVSWLGS